jgi:IS30 family transposase
MKKETGKKRKKKRSFRHLKQPDRDRIEALLDAGHTQEQVAAILQFDPGAISREITGRSGQDGRYRASVAQGKANVKRSASKHQGMKIEKHPELKKEIVEGLLAYRSPDEIAGRWLLEKRNPRIGKDAIYKWLYSPFGQRYAHLLCTRRHKKRKHQKKTKREMILNRVPLALRPKWGEHAEGDLFVSPASTGEQRSGAMVCVPSAKLLVGTMIENKKPATMVGAVQNIDSKISVDDYTWDNGMENRSHEQFGTHNYFADPHAPWQKPHVENSIGLLRRWFIKKGTNLMEVSEAYFQECLHILNGKWRKSLGYRSAYEAALERGIIQKIPAFGAGEMTILNVRINSLKVAFH